MINFFIHSYMLWFSDVLAGVILFVFPTDFTLHISHQFALMCFFFSLYPNEEILGRRGGGGAFLLSQVIIYISLFSFCFT